MTHDDAFKWTPHPYGAGESNVSPGVKRERRRVEDKNTHMGTPHSQRERGPTPPPTQRGREELPPTQRAREEGGTKGTNPPPTQGEVRSLPLLKGRKRSLPLLRILLTLPEHGPQAKT